MAKMLNDAERNEMIKFLDEFDRYMKYTISRVDGDIARSFLAGMKERYARFGPAIAKVLDARSIDDPSLDEARAILDDPPTSFSLADACYTVNVKELIAKLRKALKMESFDAWNERWQKPDSSKETCPPASRDRDICVHCGFPRSAHVFDDVRCNNFEKDERIEKERKGKARSVETRG